MDVSELAAAAQNLSFEQRKELIKTLIAQLPCPEVDETTKLAGENANGIEAPLPADKQSNPNLAWLEKHRTEYAGQWVALHEGKLIAHSTDGEALVTPVRQSGARSPLVVFVEPPNKELFVGF